MGLGDFAFSFPAQLSGGMQQRVALARLLQTGADVLLLDEPFGALDALTRADVHETFAEVRTETGCTTVLVTHDLNEASSLADQIAVMKDGIVLQQGLTDQVISRPRTGYVEDLFARAGIIERARS